MKVTCVREKEGDVWSVCVYMHVSPIKLQRVDVQTIPSSICTLAHMCSRESRARFLHMATEAKYSPAARLHGGIMLPLANGGSSLFLLIQTWLPLQLPSLWVLTPALLLGWISTSWRKAGLFCSSWWKHTTSCPATAEFVCRIPSFSFLSLYKTRRWHCINDGAAKSCSTAADSNKGHVIWPLNQIFRSLRVLSCASGTLVSSAVWKDKTFKCTLIKCIVAES